MQITLRGYTNFSLLLRTAKRIGWVFSFTFLLITLLLFRLQKGPLNLSFFRPLLCYLIPDLQKGDIFLSWHHGNEFYLECVGLESPSFSMKRLSAFFKIGVYGPSLIEKPYGFLKGEELVVYFGKGKKSFQGSLEKIFLPAFEIEEITVHIPVGKDVFTEKGMKLSHRPGCFLLSKEPSSTPLLTLFYSQKNKSFKGFLKGDGQTFFSLGNLSFQGTWHPKTWYATFKGYQNFPYRPSSENPLVVCQKGTLQGKVSSQGGDFMAKMKIGKNLCHGSLQWKKGPLSSWDLNWKIALGSLSLKELKALWPSSVLPEASQWVKSYIHAAGLEEISVKGRGSFSQGTLTSHVLQGNFFLKKGVMTFMRGLSSLTHLSSHCFFSDKKFVFSNTKGLYKDQELFKGHGVLDKNTLSLTFQSRGPLNTHLALLGFLGEKKIPLHSIKGYHHTFFTLSLPLIKNLAKKDVHLQFCTHASDASFSLLKEQILISQARFTLRATETSLHVKGQSFINSIPGRWVLQGDTLRFSLFPSKKHLESRIPRDLLSSLSFPLIIQGLHTPQTTLLSLDLSPQKIVFPWIKWEKPAGAPWSLLYDSAKKEIALKGAFHGTLRLSLLPRSFFIHSAEIINSSCGFFLRYGRKGRSHRLFFRSHTFSIPQQDNSFPQKTSISPPKQSPFLAEPQEIFFNIAFDELQTTRGTLSYPTLFLHGKTHQAFLPWYDPLHWQWQKGSLFAMIPFQKGKRGYGYGALTMCPQGKRTSIQLYLSHVGNLLKHLNISQDWTGGRLWLDGFQNAHGSYGGRVKIQNIRTKIPLLGKIVALASPTGFIEIFSPGLSFQEVSGRFAYGRERLIFDHMEAKGMNLGLFFNGVIDFSTSSTRVEGVLVPSYFLNTFFRSFPLLGWAFGGKKGFLSSEFTLSGPIAEPSIKLQPLSLFKLGFIKDLFTHSPP